MSGLRDRLLASIIENMTRRLSKLMILTFVVYLAQTTFFSSQAHAISQDMRTVIRGGTYGLVGGTIVGLAVLPLTGSVRGVFIGSSLGLYMGILMGVYRVTNRDDLGNPLRGEVQDPGFKPDSFPRSPMEMPVSAPIAVSMPVMRF